MSTGNCIKNLFEFHINDDIGDEARDWTDEQWDAAYVQAKQKVDKFFEEDSVPIFDSEEELIAFIEGFQRNPNEPHHLHRYTPAERAQRRETGKVVREAIAEYCFTRHERSVKYAHLERPWDTLLIHEGGAAEPVNIEIANLFRNQGDADEQYRMEKVGELLAKGIPQADAERQVDEAFAKRRAEIIWERYQQCDSYFDRFDEMTDPSQPAEQLAASLFNILTVTQYYMEAASFASDAANVKRGVPLIAFTEEQRDFIAAKDKLLDITSYATAKIAYITNPLYEFIDLYELSYNYDIESMNSRYEMLIESDEYADKIKALPAKTYDNLTCALGDIDDVNMTRKLETAQAAKDYVRDYGLDVNAQWSYEDTVGGMVTGKSALSSVLVNGNYLTIEQGDRAIILCPPEPDKSDVHVLNGIGELYNSQLAGKLDALMKKRASVDPGYVRSSPYFREMRTSFERLVAMAELDAYPEREQLDSFRRQLEDLTGKCKAYLDYKKGGKTDFEKSRVAFVKELKAFADMKLRQLEVIKKAKHTIERYEGLYPDDREGAIAYDRSEYITQWREEKPFEWIKSYVFSRASRAGSLGAVASAMREECETLEKLSLEQPGADRHVIRLLGESVATEILSKESDPAISGAIASLLVVKKDPTLKDDSDKLCTEVIDNLGEAALRELTGGNNTDAMSLKFVLSMFEPDELAGKLRTSFYSKYGLINCRGLHDSYMLPISELPEKAPAEIKNTLRDFTQKNILDAMTELFRSNPGKTINDAQAARRLVASCVLHGMVMLERVSKGADAPGKLEEMLAEPQNVKALQSGIMHAPDFDYLCENAKLSGDMLERRNLTTLLRTKLPTQTAQKLLNTTFTRDMRTQLDAIQAPVRNEPVREAPKAPTI